MDNHEMIVRVEERLVALQNRIDALEKSLSDLRDERVVNLERESGATRVWGAVLMILISTIMSIVVARIFQGG